MNRWLMWLDAYRAQERGDFAEAAALYERIVPLFREANLPKHADHFAEMVKICRQSG